VLEKERGGIDTDRFEVEGLEIIVFREERGEVDEILRRSTTEVVESERGEIFPASVVRIEAACGGVNETMNGWDKVGDFKILQRVQTRKHNSKCVAVPLSRGSSGVSQRFERDQGSSQCRSLRYT